jgi:PKD repeat protein
MTRTRLTSRLLAALSVCALTVTLGTGCGDDDGGPTIDAMTGGGGAPTASFTMDPDCTSSSSTEVTFTSTSTDPSDLALTCAWTFASGTPLNSTECTVTGVTFPNAAPYTVTLTVNNGTESATATQSIGPCG